tara:strand:+ start:354 stop:1259 length:906 start_codon:yes stop_codon:yes gene_type:complete
MNQRDEKLLREFVRREMVQPILEQKRNEEKVRKWVRGLIREANEENYLSTLYEAKDMANPHPNTGINKLRDAIRKAKPSIKAKYQQLTTDGTQRESFTNHFLTAMVRLFDELDALNAQGKEAEDVAGELDTVDAGDSDLQAPPDDTTSDEMADDIEGGLDDLENLQESLIEAILKEVEIEIDDDDPETADVVSDEFDDADEKEAEKNKTQAEKDFDKKSNDDEKRKEFGAGIEGDSTGRNQAFDAFNLVQTYFSDAYLDLNNPEDIEMFKKWGLYNIKLLLDKYEEQLNTNPDTPDIQDPT